MHVKRGKEGKAHLERVAVDKGLHNEGGLLQHVLDFLGRHVLALGAVWTGGKTNRHR